MQSYMKHHETLPSMVQTFEKLPKMIESESEFVQTIDYQLQTIKKQYADVVSLAMDAQKNSMTEVPGGQTLGLPKSANEILRDIEAYL